MKAFYVMTACFLISVEASTPPLPCPIGGPTCSQYKPCIPGYTCRNGVCCPSKTCKSGVIGVFCSITKPCKPGYSCVDGQCCASCPNGWTEGPSCKQGMNRCPGNYQCVDGTCCRPPIVQETCPKFTPIPWKHCDFWKPESVCDSDMNCDFGLRCCPDQCLTTTCQIPVKKKGK